MGGFRLASRPTGGRGPRGGIGRAPDLGADIVIEAKSKMSDVKCRQGPSMEAESSQPRNFLNRRRAALFFFLVAKGLSTVTRIAIRMKVEVRGKSIQPAYVIQESAELVSNIRHKSLESIGKQVRVESNTNEQFAQLFSLSLCLLSIIA